MTAHLTRAQVDAYVAATNANGTPPTSRLLRLDHGESMDRHLSMLRPITGPAVVEFTIYREGGWSVHARSALTVRSVLSVVNDAVLGPVDPVTDLDLERRHAQAEHDAHDAEQSAEREAELADIAARAAATSWSLPNRPPVEPLKMAGYVAGGQVPDATLRSLNLTEPLLRAELREQPEIAQHVGALTATSDEHGASIKVADVYVSRTPDAVVFPLGTNDSHLPDLKQIAPGRTLLDAVIDGAALAVLLGAHTVLELARRATGRRTW